MTCTVKRKLVISDIHGMYNMLIELLRKVKYNPTQDRLIFLGDMVDKGTDSKRVLEFVSQEVTKNNAIFVLGNHDDSLLSFLNGEWDIADSWLQNGGLRTVESYVGKGFLQLHDIEAARQFILKHFWHHYDTLRNARLYYEDAHRIYVHAGINPFRLDWRQSSREEFLLIREMFYRNPNPTNKPIIFGHTPTINLHKKDDIWYEKQGRNIMKIGIDGRASKGGQLNCLVIENERNYHQESVLYEEITSREVAI